MLPLRAPPSRTWSTLQALLHHHHHHRHPFTTMSPPSTSTTSSADPADHTTTKKQEPVVTQVSDLSNADSKWVALKQISYVDAAGRPRTWEVATRKTRAEPPTTTTTTPSPSPTTADSEAVDAVAVGNVLLHASRAPATVLVVQYRPPLDAWTVEWPAGLVDPGETAAQAAAREFREETGYACSAVVSVSPPQAADPGLSNATMRLVMVEVQLPEDDDGAVLPPQRLDDGERIERVVVPLAELYDRLLEYARRDRFIVAAKLFHFAAGMRFAQEQKYMKL
ncbi:ADP-ribose pyrophosphatase [Biscogniauxia mediterranea]|nr:ADP-ribose pyrophosphatase [Biscogniauxia mediterranea]